MGARQAPAEKRNRRRAKAARLTYVNDFDRGWQRRRRGQGFTYLSSRGTTLRSEAARNRIDALAIPPAWEDVWICPSATGHIQARGRDEAGRLQYIYHERWQAVSSANKYERLQPLVKLLPRIRRRVRRDLRGRKLTRQRVLATVVRLLDKALIRVGNGRYEAERGTRGATTLSSKHVEVQGVSISLDFPGKSGQRQQVEITDKKAARVIRQCEEISGQYLFCYRQDDGEYRNITSSDVNAYLAEIAAAPITAKDFRTWWANVVALANLTDLEPDLSQRQTTMAINAAIDQAAAALGNTRAICRKSYIHPGLLDAAQAGDLPELVTKARRSQRTWPELTADEILLARLLPLLETGES